MKNKILFIFCFILVRMSFISVSWAQSEIINDIVVDTQGTMVKISITSSQPLPIEAFKKESPANYIIIDFLGTVYTNLPPVIEVNNGVVQKVSLIRAEERGKQQGPDNYYPLDFLAITLSSAANYKVTQSKSVIDLDIEASSGAQIGVTEPVELKPPIIVAKATEKDKNMKVELEPIREESEETTETDMRQTTNLAFGSEKRKAKESVSKKERKKEKARSKKIEPQSTRTQDTLIDKIVQDTIQKRDQARERIEELTMQLKRMQDELNLSETEKSKIESKINEILAKLDELNSVLDAEIKRKQALGEAVDDLIATRDGYVKAKSAFETYAEQLVQVDHKVNNLNSELDSVSRKLNIIQVEKKDLEEKINSINSEYTKLKSEFDSAEKQKNIALQRTDELSKQLEQLKQLLEKSIKEKEILTAQLKSLQDKSQISYDEFTRIKKMLIEKNSAILELTKKFEELKQELEAAVSEKFKVEYAYKNAQRDYETIKGTIERYLAGQSR